MQAWHCIALISLSIAAFFYASFLDQIDKTSENTLYALREYEEETKENSTEKNSSKNSSSWAETSLVLDPGIKDEYALAFHEEALESEPLQNEIFEELAKSSAAKKLIFSPFTSEILKGSEKEILASLISIRPNPNNSLFIICKGHSMRAALLLSEMIKRTYNKLIALDQKESPLPPSLLKKLNKFQSLEAQIDELKIKIQEEMEGSSGESIQAMALRSEIMQVDEDIKQIKKNLLSIEKIHKKKLSPIEYLHIAPIRDYGKVSYLSTILEQLKSMRRDKSLNDLTRKDVEKNILITSQSLEQEVIDAIAKIKSEVSNLLMIKNKLQKSIFDHISESKLKFSQSRQVNQYKELKILSADVHKSFEDEFLRWMKCKAAYSLYPAP